MANLATSEDCIKYMMYRSGGAQSGDDFASQALIYLNLAHRKLVSGSCELDPEAVEVFKWARNRRPKTITLNPKVTTGTITATNNSTSITFTSAPASSVADWHIKTDEDGTIYRVESHTGGNTSATLDSVYVGTGGSGLAYTLFQVEYSIGSSDILRIISPMRAYSNEVYSVGGASIRSIEREWPLRDIAAGVPDRFSVLSESSGTFIVRFNKYMDTDLARVDVDYIAIPSDLTNDSGSVPLVPLHNRTVLCDFALFLLYDDKNDTRATKSFQYATEGYKNILAEHRDRMSNINDDFARPIGRSTNYNIGKFRNGYGWD